MLVPDTTIPIEAQIARVREEVAARPRLLAHYDALVRDLPVGKLTELITKHGTSKGMEGQLKYLDCPFWIYNKLIVADRLKLLEAGQSLRVLDIGMGGGHFSYILDHLGYRTAGLDLANPVYDDICATLGVRRVNRPVRLGQRLLESDERFDLITGFAMQFFRLGGGRVWTTEDWKRFLAEVIRDHLNTPGRIYFTLNKMPEESRAYVDMTAVAEAFGGRYVEAGSVLDIPVGTQASG